MMDIDQLVTDTFTAHEDLAPTEGAVLPGLRRRLRRGGGGRRPEHARPLAVAASVAVVAAATVGTVVLAGHGHGGAAAASGVAGPVASAPTVASEPAASEPTATIAPLTMPYDLGWLPSGAVSYQARRINQGATAQRPDQPVYDGEYMLTVDTAQGPVDVDVQQMPGDVGSPMFKCGTGRAVSIGGRPGVEGANSAGACGYEVWFTGSTGTTMYVNVSLPGGATGQGDRLRSIGRQIAAGIRFPGTVTVTPTFGLGSLPGGLQMVTFDVEDPSGSLPVSGTASGPTTSYQLAPSPQDQPAITLGTNLAAPPTGTPGRPVQGHGTVVRDDHGYRSLSIRDAVGGQPLTLAGSVPLAQLYAVADHLILP